MYTDAMRLCLTSERGPPLGIGHPSWKKDANLMLPVWARRLLLKVTRTMGIASFQRDPASIHNPAKDKGQLACVQPDVCQTQIPTK